MNIIPFEKRSFQIFFTNCKSFQKFFQCLYWVTCLYICKENFVYEIDVVWIKKVRELCVLLCSFCFYLVFLCRIKKRKQKNVIICWDWTSKNLNWCISSKSIQLDMEAYIYLKYKIKYGTFPLKVLGISFFLQVLKTAF